MKLISSVVTVATVWASIAQAQGRTDRESLSGGYVFEFENGHDKHDFLEVVREYGKVHMEMAYSLFNGVSVQLSDAEAALPKLKSIPGVKDFWPIDPLVVSAGTTKASDTQKKLTNKKRDIFYKDKRANSDTPVTSSATTEKQKGYTPHILTQVDKLHAKGITGKGHTIAIIDTGVDYKHPALGGCLGKGCVVVGGYDFVGKDFTPTGEPKPNNDPMDQNGSGTRNAGVIISQPNNRVEGFVGVAPGARLLAYKVTGADGITRSDILVAALHKAYDDGATVIVVPSTVAGGWREAPAALAASQIVNKGIPVISSMGDSPGYGLFMISAPASGAGVVGVTSVDNSDIPVLMYRSSFAANNGSQQGFGYQDLGSTATGPNVKAELWASPNIDPNGDACSPLPDTTPDLSKKIVLIQEGGCFPRNKIENAYKKGARYFLIYRNGPGTFSDSTALDPQDVLGVVLADVGENWAKQIKEGKTITIDLSRTSTAKMYLESTQINRAGSIQTPGAFLGGSWGPAIDLSLKPQFGAPGSGIVSTLPGGKFDVLQDHFYDKPFSAQAAAYVAGVYALLGEGRGAKGPKNFESLLSTTAKAQLSTDLWDRYLSYLAPVPKQGAGLIQAHDALISTLAIQPPSLAFNDSDHAVKEGQFTMTNNNKGPTTYKLGIVTTKSAYVFEGPGDDTTDTTYPVSVNNATVAMDLSASQVTLQPGQSATIKVRPKAIDIPHPEQLPFWSGFVTINGTDGTAMTVPYQGLGGSLHNTNMFLEPKEVTIRFSRFTVKENDTLTFPSPGGGRWGVYFSVRLPSPKVFLELISSETGKFAGKMPANPSTTVNRFGPNGFTWKDGKTADGKTIPKGKYRFRAHALKVYGDEKKQDDWSITESVNFNVDYST